MMTEIELTPFADRKELLERLRKIKHVALDMDGTIYKGKILFPFTKTFLENLKQMGIGYSFLTNNPSKSTDDYLAHLQQMGLQVSKEEIYTSAQATIGYIKQHLPQVKKIFILGTPSMTGEFESAGFVSASDDADDVPDAVVVGFDMTLNYSRLCRAAWWIHSGKPYVATNPDWVCPTDLPTILVDCGSICAMLEKATNRKPDVVLGKPQPEMLDGILAANSLKAEEVAMVGDRIYTDVAMAHNAGAFGVLVLSGEATIEDAGNASPLPDVTVHNITVLAELMEEARSFFGR